MASSEAQHASGLQSPAFRKTSNVAESGNNRDGDGTNLEEVWMGLALSICDESDYAIGFALHDGTYCIDFKVDRLKWESSSEDKAAHITEHIIQSVDDYRKEHLVKIIGTGVELELDRAAPDLCSQLWHVLDIVPTLHQAALPEGADRCDVEMIDEVAEYVARESLQIFGPTKQPRLRLSFRNEVEVDHAGMCKIATLDDYEKSVRPRTWQAVKHYTGLMKEKKIRMVFFSATPQGGGVALMRHAIIRFLKLMGVQAEWFVPRPRPDIFRITKNNHNILQGVDTTTNVSEEKLQDIHDWVSSNATRFWLKKNGPLLPPDQGGADVIVVDDPQLPELVKIAKQQSPKRPVIFRSHIEVRDDLVEQQGSSAKKVWDNLWERIREADVFISHPVRSFVPPQVDMATVGWLPATTDWLDGLNKDLVKWDTQFYFHLLRQTCRQQGASELVWPQRPYIAQVARFDPSKGIPDVLKSYSRFRGMCSETNVPTENIPQLIVCGHGSVDDPDASRIYHASTDLIKENYDHLRDDIVLVRIGPSDQLLDAILSSASVVLQLSTREGFEVKISEALHKGKPVIASRTGGIPLQIEHGKSGYLVNRGDTDAVADRLAELLIQEDSKEKYATMSACQR
ncbi:Trehalose phosphorylase [Cyphellophora attinorum]|uniref:Trehalose phosphorylase n=1 Tax=Cyphellophora attinorum TaxID=1664694 RepID=A0A0N1H6C4_9EURO|nr:Trehalose phosphorylase [Phialophora attinorum]KPI41550.1 Trehalose phosphorylase [Phialophora attinorum]